MAAPPHIVPADWYDDPAGRHEYRYWDGAGWTATVADAGVTTTDPLGPAPPLSPRPADPAPPAIPATAPVRPASGAARRPKPRWTIPVTVLATAVALALLAGLVIRAPWATMPVLQPAGLTVGAHTDDSVALRWSWPATGPAPDEYLIISNGKMIGSVPGTETSYRQTGLAPGTAYRYQVAAMRGGTRSAPSSAVAVTTAIPPISAARWQGPWTVNIKIVRGAPAGLAPTQWTESWVATPKCAAGPCSVRLAGNINGRRFTATLAAAGAKYKGTARVAVFPCEPGVASPLVRSRLRFRITVTAGHVASHVWQASAWNGVMVISAPVTVSGGFFCPGFHMTAAVSANS